MEGQDNIPPLAVGTEGWHAATTDPEFTAGGGDGVGGTTTTTTTNEITWEHDRVWLLLRGLFKESGRPINRETLYEFLGIDETDNLLTGRPAPAATVGGGGGGVGVKKNGLQMKLLYNNDTQQRQRKFDTNFSFVEKFTKDILQEIELIKGFIMKNEPPQFPDMISNYEYLCLLVRATLSRDDWYECGATTTPRGPYIGLMPLVFILELHYRVWRRHEFLFIPPGGDDMPAGPIWYTRSQYTSGEFPVLKDQREYDIIMDWSPSKIHRALNTLFHGRRMQLVDVSNRESIANCYQYQQALFDMVALHIVFSVKGTPEEISEANGVRWFRLTTDTLDAKSFSASVNPAFYAVSKEIADHQTEETSRKRKKMALMYNDESTNKKHAYTISKDERHAQFKKKADEKDLEFKKAALAMLRIRLKFLISGGMDDETDAMLSMRLQSASLEDTNEDKIQVEIVKKEIDQLTETIRIEQARVNSEKMRQNALKLSAAMNIATVAASAAAFQQSYSCAQVQFVKEIMLLYDHIRQWQFTHGLRCESYSIVHSTLKRSFRDDIISVLKMRSEDQLLLECREWIAARDVDFHEREAYRQARSDGAIFNSIDVSTYVRGTSGLEMANTTGDKHDGDGKEIVEDEEDKSGFPTDLCTLLYDNEDFYYSRAWNYFVWWYCTQNIAGTNVESTIFLWDLELQYLSLQRKRTLASPVMGLVGYNWIVMINDLPWRDHEFECLSGLWCGYDALDALTCWTMRMQTVDWIIVDRITEKKSSLQHSRFNDLLDAASTACAGTGNAGGGSVFV